MATVSQKLDQVMHGLAFEKIEGESPKNESDPLLARLKALGSEVWIDTGELAKAQEIWKDELTALTTNNTLANQVVQSGAMDKVIEDTIHKIRQEGKPFAKLYRFIRKIEMLMTDRVIMNRALQRLF